MEFQVKNMDYWSLVTMLMGQITPEIRKYILERLTEMNNQLLFNSHLMSQIQPVSTSPSNHPVTYSKKESEINVDDIIDDIQKEPDELDKKLERIKYLKDKIITEKRRRRMISEKK